MYCPACGAASTFGLNYCKRCGGNLSETAPMTGQPMAAQDAPSSSRMTGAAWALALATVAICLAGLGIVFSYAFDLARPLHPGETRTGDVTPLAITMIVFGSATIFGVVTLLVRLFARFMALPEEPAKSAAAIKPAAASRYTPGQLAAPQSSVTEHTTRTFKPPVYNEASTHE